MFNLFSRLFWILVYLTAVMKGNSLSQGKNITNRPFFSHEIPYPNEEIVENWEMVTDFVEDVVKESKVMIMVFILSPDVQLNLEKGTLPLTIKVTYNIHTLTLNDISNVHRRLARSNQHPIYLVSSKNNSELSTA